MGRNPTTALPPLNPRPRRGPPPGRPAPRAPPPPRGRLGREHPKNVLLAHGSRATAGGMSFRLAFDPAHPFFFDHPMDHVPGMLLLEAARQAALATLAEHRGVLPQRCLLVGCEVDFGNFCEPDLVTHCTAAIDETYSGAAGFPRRRVRVGFQQAGAALGAVTLDLLDETGSG
ncbi:AfsA-related hotdog domain-containing protein [Nocardia brasiliensis]|uniref:AfsA-related hotdog domain-containing protein n=1 Tax=Nocardia brasiliensis TaxID=37326 RepID=UPI002454A40C|nr:AfsA-related hotdog domain-containing protein [Nocardia brasiliensis]